MADIDNTPVTSAIHMDRGTPIGNSNSDVDNRRALHVKLKNNPSDVLGTVNVSMETVDIGTVDQGAPTSITAAWPVFPTDHVNHQSYTAANEANVVVTQSLPSGTNSIGGVTQSGAWVVGRTWLLAATSDSVTAFQGGSWSVSAVQSGGWTTGRTWLLASTSDSVSATQQGTWTVQQGTPPWSVSQSGSWSTGRTWTLAATSDSVSAVQSGNWDVRNITGTVSLPTGASTAALQSTGNTSLNSIDSKLNTLGQKAATGSIPVVLATDQSPLPVTQSGTWTTGRTWILAATSDFVSAVQSGNWDIRNVTGTVSLPTGAATSSNQTNGSQKVQLVDASGVVVGPVMTNVTTNHMPVYLPLDVTQAVQNITTQDVGSASATGYAGQVFFIGNPTAGSTASYTLNSIQTVMIEVKGIWTGTLAIEVSSDAGITWVARGIHVVGTAIFSSSVTANVIGSLNGSAKTNVRVRATAAVTGTANVTMLVSDNPSNVYVANPIKVVDGSSVTSSTLLTIKAASSAAGTADTSVVVGLSPNSPLPTGSNVIGGVTQSGAFTTGRTWLLAATSDSIAAAQSGTWTVQQGATPTSVANAWPFKLTDGTNTATVKAASTPAVSTDTALVVALSPNALSVVSTKTPLTDSSPTVSIVAATSGQALASNVNRKGLVLTNVSINKISLGLGSAAVLNSGITLYPGGTWEMSEYTFTTAAINAIASVASSNLGIQEFTT